MARIIIDETAITAMYVYETIIRMLEKQPTDHPIHAWRQKLSSVETRYQSISMAFEINVVWNSFPPGEIEPNLFEEIVVPKMLEQMDFSTADADNPPKFKADFIQKFLSSRDSTKEFLLTNWN